VAGGGTGGRGLRLNWGGGSNTNSYSGKTIKIGAILSITGAAGCMALRAVTARISQ